MFWSSSFELMPGEQIIDDTQTKRRSGIKPAYSVLLTNRRVIFRFDSLGSNLSQSFLYGEILEANPSKRIFISYLNIRTQKKNFLLNVSEPEYWAEKITDIKRNLAELTAEKNPEASHALSSRSKRELLDMLSVLRKHELLTEEEFDEKVKKLGS